MPQGAYIIENAALDYDSDDAFGLTTIPTNIKATNYRNFVSQRPKRASYFQPVIEKLEYVVPELIGTAPFVVVEGISDFYALKFAETLLGETKSFSLIPGTGASASSPLISLLISRGEQFVILLDDDKAGKNAVKKYRDEWYLSDKAIITLGELHSSFANKRLEDLISMHTKTMIGDWMKHSPSAMKSPPTKKEIGLFFAEMCAIGPTKEAVSSETFKTLSLVLSQLKGRLSHLDS